MIQYGDAPKNYKVYTLEEFEKKFPFKIGDLCIYSSDILGKDIVVNILGMTIENDCIMYEVGHKDITKGHSHIYRKREALKPYKEMNTRNVTLTLDKAKEWYKKGGELKEIALQAFTEEELTKIGLPKTWEEFRENNPVKVGECWLAQQDIIHQASDSSNRTFKNWIPSKKSAEAHLAMIQLEQLRDCWRNGWEPIWDCSEKWCIRLWGNELGVGVATHTARFLTFPTNEMAKEFLECFRDLIEKAGDLI
jgi:hypothetical protein